MPQRYISLTDLLRSQAAGQVRLRCPACGEASRVVDLEAKAMVCPWCDFHLPVEAHPRLDLLVDPASFQPLEQAPAGPALFGRATLHGQAFALVVSDPSSTWTAAEVHAFVAAVEGAARDRIPLCWVATAAQGVDDLTPWAGLPAALGRLAEAGQPWLALVAGPCYGPPAALALQADLVLAEPGAVVAPVLPQVLHQAGRWPLESARPARDLLRSGWCDAVVPRHSQRAALADMLDLLGFPGRTMAPRATPPASGAVPATPLPAVLADMALTFCEVHGDRRLADDRALLGGLARLAPAGPRALILATQAGPDRAKAWRRTGAIGAAGWHKATRLLQLAGRFGLPVVTVLDRPGMRVGLREQPAAVAAAMGQTLCTLLTLPVPTLSVCLQADCGLAGLTLAATDSLLVREDGLTLCQLDILPDATFRTGQMPSTLARVLQDLTQTYAVHGPLGRRKLLQRRYARWLRQQPAREVPE